MARELEKTLAKLVQARRRRGTERVEANHGPPLPEPPRPTGRDDMATFRPIIEERLRSLEQQIAEVKLRVNGLLFLLAGTVATEIVRRIVS